MLRKLRNLFNPRRRARISKWNRTILTLEREGVVRVTRCASDGFSLSLGARAWGSPRS